MKFNHLNVPTHWQNYWTRYPEGHTILEALISWVSQVDSMVDNQNKLNDNVNQFRNEINEFVERFDDRLQTEVTNTLKDWQDSGFLDVVISEALQWQLDDYITTNELDKDTLSTHLQQLALNVTTFGAKMDRVTDDTQAIQEAIDTAHLNGGGNVFIPSGYTRITSTIQVKENVKLYGNRDTTVLYDSHTGSAFSLHKRTVLESVRLSFIDTHDDVAVLVDNQYASHENVTDKSFGNKIIIRDIYAFSSGLVGKQKNIGLHFIADSNNGGGLYQVLVDNCYFHNFDTVIQLETKNAGWVNGNVFSDITATGFITGVKVVKSTNSQGIDYNIFRHLNFQAGVRTKNMIEDTTNANTYTELEIWDLKTNPNARMGTASTIFSNFSGKGKSKLYLSNAIVQGYYYLIGNFDGGGTARFFKMSLSNGFSYDTELLMLGTKLVTRRQKGLLEIPNDEMKFYTKEIAGGRFEVYLYSNATRDVSVYIENYEGFAPGMFTYYTEVDGLTEVTNERNHIYSQQDGIVESGANYNKFANGTMECWGSFSQNPLAVETVDATTGIVALTCDSIPFPQAFISNPNVFGNSLTSFRPISVKFSRTPTNCTPTVYTNTESLAVAQTFNWFAVGKWK